MGNFESIIRELNRKNVSFFVKTNYKNNQPVGRVLSKITLTTKTDKSNRTLYYANGALIRKRLALKLIEMSP